MKLTSMLLAEQIELTRRNMLWLQQQLIEGLPEYVKVSVTGANTMTITGDFDTINITIEDNKFKIGTTYANSRWNDLPNSAIADLGKYSWNNHQGPWSDILIVLNRNVGLRKLQDWLLSHEFEPQSPSAYKDTRTTLVYLKEQPDGLLAQVGIQSDMKEDGDGYVQVSRDKDKLWMANKEKFNPKSVNRLEAAINHSVEEFEQAEKSHGHTFL